MLCFVKMKREFSVVCLSCPNIPEIGRSELEPVEVIPWLLNAHATRPHTNHKLSVEVNGQENFTEGDHDVEIKCTLCFDQPGKRHGAYRKHRAPLEMVGALILMLHTRHEAHPLELKIDGKVVAT